MLRLTKKSAVFQSTLPARGATGTTSARHTACIFQSTLPARGATPFDMVERIEKGISIHAPRTGSDSDDEAANTKIVRFQSTLPARGATANTGAVADSVTNFNPRSPHGERLPNFSSIWSTIGISIHAPRTGSDRGSVCNYIICRYFNPRSPHGERLHGAAQRLNAPYFNPRSPHGERLITETGAKYKSYISIHAPRTGSD